MVGSRLHLDVGTIDLGSLPRLDLRFEDSRGAPSANRTVWIRALDPAPFASIGSQGFPEPKIRLKTDCQGSLTALLPAGGEYSIAISDGENSFRCRDLLVQGDQTRVIHVPQTEHVYLRLVHATSRERLGELACEMWMTSSISAGENNVRMASGHTRSDGLFELLLPAGTETVFLRPVFAGYQTKRLARAEFAGSTLETPLEVSLHPGVSVQLVFDEWPRNELGDELELYLIATEDLGLVRDELPSGRLMKLAARGRSVRFVDPLLQAMLLGHAAGALSVEGSGLTPGFYAIVAFDRTRRRTDVRYEPAEFEVGPEFSSIELHLRQ